MIDSKLNLLLEEAWKSNLQWQVGDGGAFKFGPCWDEQDFVLQAHVSRLWRVVGRRCAWTRSWKASQRPKWLEKWRQLSRLLTGFSEWNFQVFHARQTREGACKKLCLGGDVGRWQPHHFIDAYNFISRTRCPEALTTGVAGRRVWTIQTNLRLLSPHLMSGESR